MEHAREDCSKAPTNQELFETLPGIKLAVKRYSVNRQPILPGPMKTVKVRGSEKNALKPVVAAGIRIEDVDKFKKPLKNQEKDKEVNSRDGESDE